MRRRRHVVLLACALAATGCRHDGRTLRTPGSDQNGSISVPTTPAEVPLTDDTAAGTEDEPVATDSPAGFGIVGPWTDGGAIPRQYTCDGANTSPPLTWDEVPAGTTEIAVSLTDDDAPDFMHWVVVGIDPATTSINENDIPEGALEGTNDEGVIGYSGPCPPGGETHTYRFTVHFLDQQVEVAAGDTDAAMLDAISMVEFDSIDFVGTYTRAGSTAGSGARASGADRSQPDASLIADDG